jgi:ATP-dependent Clp protease ATP-binding subunit ClpX
MAYPRYFRKEDDLSKFVESLPMLTPREMFHKLSALGYKAQDEARRAICLMAYRHIRRIKKIYAHGTDRAELPPKSNILMMGPTGCGKTFLIELLFHEILKLPTVIIDITGFTETGYVGRDVITILTSLIKAANDDPVRAGIGVVCIDEFDKLASTQNVARFEGQGTTKDVAGYGVQKELLKLLSSTSVDVPLEYNNTYYSSHVRMSTDDMAFIACGAFSGFKGLVSMEEPKIGYRPGAENGEWHDDIAYELQGDEINNITNFQLYGFLPELIARFARVVALPPLDRRTLRRILEDNAVPRFVNEFRHEGLVLKIEDAVLDLIVNRALERRVGARGLEMEVTRIVESAAFENFGRGMGEVRVTLKNGEPVVVPTLITPDEAEPSAA